jgi:hypothetical protein
LLGVLVIFIDDFLFFSDLFFDNVTFLSKKSPKIAKLLEDIVQNRGNSKHDIHYLGYFECFNQKLYYEAHDVLEELWLKKKGEPCFLFYKGLIQLAGAFVHMTKSKLNPAARLLRLAQKNLEIYPKIYEDLDVQSILTQIGKWISELESSDYKINPFNPNAPPRLALLSSGD